MRSTILQTNPHRMFALRLVMLFAVLSSILLPLALWFGPISLRYLGASAVIGILFAILVLNHSLDPSQRWGRHLWPLTLVIVPLGLQISRDIFFSLPLRLHYQWWLVLQGIAIVLIVFAVILAFEERVVTLWPGFVGCVLLLGIAGVAWYRTEQAQPLIYPSATSVMVEDDAPPGARKISFTTMAEPTAILSFYRLHLEQWGWQFTCSTEESNCESNITEGRNWAHDVYHRRTDTDFRGPSYEILVRPNETGGMIVEVYDQTRGLPNQL